MVELTVAPPAHAPHGERRSLGRHVPEPAPPERRPERRPVATVAAAGAVAVGLGVVVGHDGSPVWQVVRLLVVAGVFFATATVLRQARRAKRVRILVAFTLALVAVPVGVGIGGPFLVKSGLTVEAVAGLLTLIGGLVLFGAAITWTVRATRRRVGWPACGFALVSLFVFTWTLGQAVAATNTPRPTVGSRTPADSGLAYRDVTFDATDGVALSGWYVPSRNGAAVVLLHGSGSTRSDVLDHALVLARHGYGVLLFDARGHGRSAGRAMDFGWFGDRDIGGAVTFVTGQPDVNPDRIAAIGMSMGGEEAIGAAATVKQLRAVVAEGATNRVAADKAWLSDEYGASGAVTEAVESLTYGFADLLTSANPPISLRNAVRAAAPRPVLLIAAGDVADEALAGRYIQSGSPDTVDLWVVPGTGHTHGLDTHPDEWESRVVAFLDRALGVNASGTG